MLVGGGNSRFDPAFSTFSLVRGRVRCVAPDAAALRLDGHRLMAQYTCAGVGCEVVISLLDDRRAELAFRAGAGECRPVGAFTLRLRPGSELAAPDAPKPRSVHPRHSFLIAAPDADPPEGFIVAGEGWRLRLPPGGKFSWPHFPSDPYALNYGAPDGAAVASVSAALRPGGDPVRFRFEIAP